MTVEERFWAKVHKTDGCWFWIGSEHRGANSYGSFHVSRHRHVKTHRFSWELANGAIPDGKHVLHTCDTPQCVNPAHLFLGTGSDNIRDCYQKGRHTPPDNRGERSGLAKLTAEQVLYIRKHYKWGNGWDLAKRFGVSRGQITHIIKRRRWNHLA